MAYLDAWPLGGCTGIWASAPDFGKRANFAAPKPETPHAHRGTDRTLLEESDALNRHPQSKHCSGLEVKAPPYTKNLK